MSADDRNESHATHRRLVPDSALFVLEIWPTELEEASEWWSDLGFLLCGNGVSVSAGSWHSSLQAPRRLLRVPRIRIVTASSVT